MYDSTGAVIIYTAFYEGIIHSIQVVCTTVPSTYGIRHNVRHDSLTTRTFVEDTETARSHTLAPSFSLRITYVNNTYSDRNVRPIHCQYEPTIRPLDGFT